MSGGVFVKFWDRRARGSEVKGGEGQPSKERPLLHISSSAFVGPAHSGDVLEHTSTAGVLVVSPSCLRLVFRQ
jgi:hypothetical protein